MGIKYSINPKIVRGLDYYTKTVFEFIAGSGKQRGTVCGGGRYDGMIEQMGGKPTPALGFAIGLERILLNLKDQGFDFGDRKTCDVYIAPMGEKAAVSASVLVKKLRDEGYWAECDLMERALGKQMKYADKIGAKFAIVLGFPLIFIVFLISYSAIKAMKQDFGDMTKEEIIALCQGTTFNGKKKKYYKE